MRKKLTKTERQAVQEFVDALATAFPERIKLMRLFGSRARGQRGEQSDLDLLIVVDKEDEKLDDKIIDLMGKIGGKYIQLIAPLTVSNHELENLNYQLYRLLMEVRHAGIDFWRSPDMPEEGGCFIEKVVDINIKKGGDGMKRMIREQIAAEVREGRESLRASRVLIDHDLYSDGVSKAYFAMFHLSQAILLSRRIERKKHSQLIGAFHHQFRKSGEIENKFHRGLDKAYEDRQKADYKRFKFSKEEAEKRFSEAQAFIERIEELLKLDIQKKDYSGH
ncbi:MAG: HEPN domain-containing protein [bacterium]